MNDEQNKLLEFTFVRVAHEIANAARIDKEQRNKINGKTGGGLPITRNDGYEYALDMHVQTANIICSFVGDFLQLTDKQTNEDEGD